MWVLIGMRPTTKNVACIPPTPAPSTPPKVAPSEKRKLKNVHSKNSQSQESYSVNSRRGGGSVWRAGLYPWSGTSFSQPVLGPGSPQLPGFFKCGAS